jgi:GGDEF domain-containing protein
VLQEVGKRLDDWLRSQGAQIARLGGDELAIVTARLLDENDVGRLCQDVGQVLRHRFPRRAQLRSRPASASPVTRTMARASPDLLRCADIAMYQAKKAATLDFIARSAEDDTYTLERLPCAHPPGAGDP